MNCSTDRKMLLILLHMLALLSTITVRTVSMSASSAPFATGRHRFQYLSFAPSQPPYTVSQGPAPSLSVSSLHGYRHQQHRIRSNIISPSPSASLGCDQICEEPLTSSPFGSPCMCVFPMRVRLSVGVSHYAIFPEVTELEIEVAAGTYLKQSQVTVTGVTADEQNQDRTVVDINLVPLGEKFDNTTAIFTYERLLHKKVPLNRALFGDYAVINISYPGLPSSPQADPVSGDGPSGRSGNQQNPIAVDIVHKNQKMNSQIILVSVFSVVLLMVVCLAAVLVLVKCRKANRQTHIVAPSSPSACKQYGRGSMLLSSPAISTSASIPSPTRASILSSVKTFSLSELESATERFNRKRVLGEGGFGRVYHGIMEDGNEVAVKLLTRDNRSGEREFLTEIEMLSRLHHRNLVKLFGICVEQHTRCLVYELVSNGSVESHLHGPDRRKGLLDWDARLKIALGAARGLAYLHEDSNPRIIHRDFKASNVLLEDDFTPKVSDFGLAREATEGSQPISTRVMGTFGYVAPEYAMTGHLLVKSDVYSYGVVMLELLSGRKPVDMSQPLGQENLVTWARPLLTNREGLEQLVDPALAGSYDFDNMAKIAAIASMCVHPEVAHRPFMGEVVQALKLIYNDTDKTCGDSFILKESSTCNSDFKGDTASDQSWWNEANSSPRLTTYGPFFTMDYSSDPCEVLENRPLGSIALPSRPLGKIRGDPAPYTLQRSRSEHIELPKCARCNGVGHASSC